MFKCSCHGSEYNLHAQLQNTTAAKWKDCKCTCRYKYSWIYALAVLFTQQTWAVKKKKKIDAHTVTLPVPRMRLPRPDVFPNSLCHNWWVAVILSFWCECFATRWLKLPRKLTFSDFLWSQLVEMQQKSGSPLFKNCGVSDDCKDEFGLSHVDTAKQECFASFFAAPRMTCHVGDIKSNEILLLQEMYSFTAFLCGHAYLQLKNIQKLMVRDNRK